MSKRVAGTALPLLMLFPSPFTPRGERVEGYLSQMNERPSAGTLQYRIDVGEILHPQLYDGFIATSSCELIGDEAWLSIEGGDWLFVAVADCSGHASTTRWMEENRIIAEVFYDLAEEYDFVGRGGVEATLVWSES